MNDILIITGITEGERVRLTRLARGLRQVDLASLAKVNVCDVTALEKNRYLKEARKRKVLAILDLDNDSENESNDG